MKTVEFVENHNGLPALRIKNAFARALIYPHGGQVVSFRPNGAEDVLWVSKFANYEAGKAIRGGIPVCWPWFGAPDRDSFPNAAVSHGIVRLMDWDVDSCGETEDGATRVVLSISDNDATRKIWPFEFSLKLSVKVAADLSLALTTANTGKKAFTITQALHTYFNVGDISKTTLSGFDGVSYVDTVEGSEQTCGVQHGDISFAAETDSIYTDFSGAAVINDNANNRKIRIVKDNSNTSVVWNPWVRRAAELRDFGNDEYKNMLCVESCNICGDSKTILPGASHTLRTVISVE